MFGSRSGSTSPSLPLRRVARSLAALLLGMVLPTGAQAATASVNIDLSTGVSAFDLVIGGCPLTPPPPMGPGPATYSYGQTTFTTGAAPGNHVFEVTALGAVDDPEILLYQGAGGFDPLNPATNLVACELAGGFANPFFPRLVTSLTASTTYTVVVIVPEVAPSGTLSATLGLGLEPTITYANKSVAVGAIGESMTATSNSTGAISYTSQFPFTVADIHPTTGALSIVALGSTQVAAIQAAEAGAGTYGSGVKEATLTVTSASLTSQTITFANPGAQNFGTSPTLTATTTSGLTVTFSSNTTGVCTITAGGALTFVTAGTCTINADQAGDATYSAATQVSRSFSVNAVVPGAPTIGTATAGNAQATVTFTAPASNGGSAITTYTATSNPAGGTGTCTAPCTSITVTGLTNGTAYNFTVTATNVIGTGSASAASNSVAPSAPPTAVSAVTISASPLIATSATTMTVVFRATTALVAADTITVKLTGYAFTAGAVTITAGTGLTGVLTGAVVAGALDTVVVTGGVAAAGTSLTFSFPATNPAAGTIAAADLTVKTSKDTTPVASASDIVIATASVATKLVFSVQPGGAVAGVPFTNQPVVSIQDASGNTVTASTATVTLSKKSGSGSLTCGPVAAVAGVATFSGCSVDTAGTGFAVTASSGALTAVDSTAFDVAAPPALSSVGITLSNAFANATAVSVTVTFQTSTALPSSGKIRVALPGFSSPAAPVATFTAPHAVANTAAFANGILTVTTVAGTSIPAGTVTLVVTGFTNPAAGTIPRAGLTVQTFTSADAPITSPAASSNDLVITSATGAAKLAFVAQPGGAIAGRPFAAQPKVAILDASGNTVTTTMATVTLSKKSGSGTLTCGPVAVVSGVASFSGCSIDTVGTGFVLTASATGLTSADSVAFDVVMPAPAVTSINPNSGPTTGGTRVTILGSFFTGANSVTIGGVAATDVEVLSATQITATTPAGTAGPTDVAVTTPGGTGTGVGLFTYAGSVASRLAFITQPAGAVAGAAFTTQPRVAIQDANGRTVTTSTATVTLAKKIGTGTLTCSPVTAVAGIATFSGCRVDMSGTGLVLTATSTGLTSADSAAFNVQQPVTATKLVMAPISGPLTAGRRFGVTVSATDAAGNASANQKGSVTLATSSVSSSSSLQGVLTVPFVNGVATFTSLHFGASGQYTLTASAVGLTSATSPAITVTASTTVTGLRFTSQPVAEASGVVFATQPVVRAEFEDGTLANSFTGTVGLALGKTGGTTTAVLGGTVTAAFANGVASFPGVRVNGADRDLYLTATAGTLTGSSGAFRVFSTSTEAATARAAEQVTASAFSLTLDVACTSGDCLAALKSDLCKALALDSVGCARLTVFSQSTSSSASSKRDDSSTGKAGAVPPDAALERCGEVALDANGEAILPACPVAGPGTYSYALSVPGQPLMASRPYTVLASLEGAQPEAPGNLRVEPGDGVAVVSWDPPAATGAWPIIAYEVYGMQEGSPEALLARDSLTSKTLKLVNGSVWRFGVRAANDVGKSDMVRSTPVAIGVAPGAPGKPRLSRSQGPSGDEVEVTWDIPPGNPVEFEAISSGGQRCRRGNFGKGFASASCKVAVESGKTYTFRVVARNAVGSATSPESDALVISPGRIDGKCGAMAQQASLVMPTADLCEAGAAGGAMKPVQGAWKWQCEGLQGGSAASCSTTTGAAALGLWPFRATPVSAALMAKAAGAGCRLQRAESVAVGIADGPGSGAVMPYGAVGIELADCEGGMADVTISYPVVVEGMAFHALVGGQWFLTPPPGTGLQVKAGTVTFRIADNGPWDADPQAGIISFVGGVGSREEWLTNVPAPPASVMVKPGATWPR